LYDPIAVFGICDNNSAMELRHLRYFAAVAEHLNYSEASRRLHVAQAAISQTIFDLEEELGTRLLLRTKRNVQLTAVELRLQHMNPDEQLAAFDECRIGVVYNL
jgi:hypothetical protein